jgi:predicted nucleic acid-binding protein
LEEAFQKVRGNSIKLVIDTNIVFSALIKDSFTRRLILHPNLKLYCIEELLVEIANYKDQIMKRSQLSEEAFDIVFTEILKQITIIPYEKIMACEQEAKNLIEHRDTKDIPFLALALCIDVEGIWSNDMDFDVQDKIKRFSTNEVNEELFKHKV